MTSRPDSRPDEASLLTEGSVAVILVGVTAALFWKVVFLGQVLYFGDLMLQFLPWRGFANETLRHGLLPLWNPYSFCGEPFLANPQTALFYPWNLLGLFVSPARWLSWGAVGHTWLLAWGMYAFLRELRVSRPGGVVGALAVAAGGFVVSRHQFPSMIDTLAWLPWVLLWTHRMLAAPSVRRGVAVSVVTGLHLLAGHAQMSLFIFGLQAAYGVRFFAAEGYPPVAVAKRAGWLVPAIVGGGLVAALQLLPAVELVQHSTRGGLTVSDLTLFSLPWWQLPGLVYPLLFGTPALGNYWGMGNFWEMCGYVGTVPLLVAVCGLAKSPRRERWLAAVLFGTALVLAMGRYSPVFDWTTRLLPFARLFRAPTRFLFFCSFSLAVLAAFGIDALVTPGSGERTRALLHRLAGGGSLVSALAVATLLTAGLAWPAGVEAAVARCFAEGGKSAPPEALAALAKAAWISGLSALSFGLVWFTSVCLLPRLAEGPSGRRVVVLLVGLTALELCVTGSPLNPTTRVSWLQRKPGVVSHLQHDAPSFRCWTPLENVNDWWSRYASYVRYGKSDASTLAAAADGFAPNLNLPYRIANASGYNPLRVRWLWEEFERVEDRPGTPRAQRFLDLAAVRYVVRFHPQPPSPTVTRRASALPRTTLWREEDVEPDSYPPARTEPAAEVPARYDLNEVAVHYTARRPRVLVLGDTFYPGWRVRLDERPRPVRRVFCAFRGVDVPAGSHALRFVYMPQSFRLGVFLSLLSLLALTAMLVQGLVGGRRKKNTTVPEGE